MDKLTKTILEALSSFKNDQINLSSSVARKMLAEKISKQIKQNL